MQPATPLRVVSYTDGFNLYFGLRDSGWRRFYWLDIHLLSHNLLRPDQHLVRTKYFTSRISGARQGLPGPLASKVKAKRKRQSDYLEALATRPGLEIYEGHYLEKSMHCNACGAIWASHEEKMTDVNIATEILVDAHQDIFDVALIISADSDLVPPVQAVRRLFPQKQVVAAFPPGRFSANMKSAATAQFVIGRGKISQSQLPDQIAKPNGYVLHRPATWK